MEQYNKTQRLLLGLKFSLVKILKKILPHYYFDRWIEPMWYWMKRLGYKIHYALIVSIKIRHRKSVIFLSGEWMTPGHYYRVERYVESYRNLGFHAFWFKPDSVYSNSSMLNRCTLLIIWRTEMSENLRRIIQQARNNKIKIIYDLDDFMFDPEMARPEIIDGIRSMGLEKGDVKKMYSNIRQASETCDIITCPTDYLSRAAQKTGRAAYVLPNGYDDQMLMKSVSLFRNKPINDKFLRIGYAGGTRTHQKDFRVALPALIRILNEFPNTLITVFGEALLIDEFEMLKPMRHRIEFRDMVPVKQLQEEIARFDINIAPLEIIPFCEAKSELKYFEAALLQIPTIASPTEPYRAVIVDGFNGFLASDADEWYDCLRKLIVDEELRKRIGHQAFNQVLWYFSTEERINITYELLTKIGEADTILINHRKQRLQAIVMRDKLFHQSTEQLPCFPIIPDYEVVREYRKNRYSKVGVIIPLYNYENFVLAALESVKAQNLKDIDLIIADDCSTDASLEVVSVWIDKNHQRFNNCAILKNVTNSKLASTRNAAFDFIQTQYVMPLDADNELLPHCLSLCLKHIENSGASVAYPQLEVFGIDKKYILETYYTQKLGFRPWLPERLAEGNYIDAMAMISKAAWSKVGGYDTTFQITGWEDYDLWLRFIEHGLFGISVSKVAARYRVHDNSMLREAGHVSYQARRQEIFKRHPWVRKYELQDNQT